MTMVTHSGENTVSPLDSVITESIEKTKILFSSVYNPSISSLNEQSTNEARKSKFFAEYAFPTYKKDIVSSSLNDQNNLSLVPVMGPSTSESTHDTSASSLKINNLQTSHIPSAGSRELVRRREVSLPKPIWHAPWKLMRVISGHTGWVRSVSVDVSNEWFATGSGDRTIKIWDLASGTLKLSLTGHLSTVRGLEVSDRHPYLFSAGEDKLVKCWDLEQNKVIRHYHGHLSGVYALSLHPTLDILVTAGRDAVGRVWDMRTKQPIFTLAGHSSTIAAVKCQASDPQVITSSMDCTVRLWDLKTGKTMTVLTHHKKSVRAIALHPREFTFASASPDSIKKFQFPNGDFLHNFNGHNAIINTLSVNEDNVLFSGADNGSIGFWDWRSGHCFQKTSTIAQPGSLDSETGIFTSTFDRTGLRLITCEADKSIKIWKEDDSEDLSDRDR